MVRLLAQAGLLALIGVVGGEQAREAPAVLADVRTALGGPIALDAVRTLSVNGSVTESSGAASKGFSCELFALLPDHFLVVRSDRQPGGPLPIDITYYLGFRGDVLIRRTDSNIPFPPDPGPQTPDAIAERERGMLLRKKQDFARLMLLLFGQSTASYPLQFSFVGVETVEGRSTEVLEGRSADGFAMRLAVDAATHLPAIIAWQAPPPVILTTSSTTIMSGNRVVSQSPPSPVPSGDRAAGRPPVTWRLVVSDFKLQDGFNWPHRLRVMVGTRVTEDTRLGRYKINPKIDAKTFRVE